MGIAGLLPMLKDIQRPIHVKEWSGKSLAVDAYVWLHRGAYGCAEDLAQGKPTVQYVNYSMHRVRMLKHFGVTPLIVFDGGLLPSKMGTEGDRERRRSDALAKGNAFLAEGQKSLARDCFVKGVDVTPEMAYQLIKALRREGIQYIVAPYEADPQLAYLERHGFVDGIITEDSDLLVFGCRNVLFKLDGDGNCVHVARAHFSRCREYDFSGWSDKEFRQMAILSGCDYVESIVGLGLKTAYRLMRKYKTAEKVIQFVRLAGQHKVPIDYPAQFQRAELTFCHQRVYDPTLKTLVHLEPLLAGADASAMPFVGASMDDSFAQALANGDIDPLSRKPMVDIAPDKFVASQIPFKPPPFHTTIKPKASTSATLVTGAGSILSFFRPASQPTPSAPLKGKGRLSLPLPAKRTSQSGNLEKAKKENDDSRPVVARSKFFGGAPLTVIEPEEFPDDEGVDYDESERECEDDGIDIDGEEYLRELELVQVAQAAVAPPSPAKHAREPSVVSSFDGISSPPLSSPPRKRQRVENPEMELDDDVKPSTQDMGISSPPPTNVGDDGVLSSPPLLKKSVGIKLEPIAKGKRKRAPSSDPIDVFSESPAPEDDQPTPRRRNAVVTVKKERKPVLESTEEVDEVPINVAKAWRSKWEHKGSASTSKPLASPSARKALSTPSATASPATRLAKPRHKPSPLPLAGPLSKAKPLPRLPLSPKKLNTIRPVKDVFGGGDDERPNAALLAFRYTGGM